MNVQDMPTIKCTSLKVASKEYTVRRHQRIRILIFHPICGGDVAAATRRRDFFAHLSKQSPGKTRAGRIAASERRRGDLLGPASILGRVWQMGEASKQAEQREVAAWQLAQSWMKIAGAGEP